jgi:hypothetical protein
MGFVRASLHEHLKTGGWPGKIKVNSVVDKAVRTLGENGVLGVTNYSPATRYEDLANSRGYERDNLGNALYFRDQKIVVVKGDEIMVRLPEGRAEILALGTEEGKHPRHNRPLEDTLREIHDLRGIAGIIHPFHLDGLGPYLMEDVSHLEGIDFFETFNGEASLWLPGATRSNQKAEEFFAEVRTKYLYSLRNLGRSVASDGHSIYEIGANWIQIPALDLTDRGTIVESLRQGLMIAANQNLEAKDDTSGVNITGALDHLVKAIIGKSARKLGIRIGSA